MRFNLIAVMLGIVGFSLANASELVILERPNEGTRALDINDAGQVLIDRYVDSSASWRPMVWTAGVFRSLNVPPPPGLEECDSYNYVRPRAFKIGLDGSVVGGARLNVSPNDAPVIWAPDGTPQVHYAAEQSGDPLRFCNPYSGIYTAINSERNVVGHRVGLFVSDAFRSVGGGYWTPLSTPASTSCQSYTYDINEAGFIAGAEGVNDGGGCAQRPTIWHPDGTLQRLSEHNTEAIAINRHNQVLTRLYLWENGNFRWLNDGSVGNRRDLNDAGVVLTDDSVVMPDGMIYDVTELMPQSLVPSDLLDRYPNYVRFVAINNDGVIVGTFEPLPAASADTTRAFVLRADLLITECPGDTNGDNQVNFTDLNAVLSAFGQTGSPGFTGADLNADGVVNFVDLNTILSAFGISCG